MPKGEVSRVPISAARVRSTEIRDLNKQYHAVSIEKLYKLDEQAESDGLVIKGMKGQVQAEEGLINLAQVFTREVKKERQAAGEVTRELINTFLIKFESDKRINIKKLVSDYQALEVVVHAEEVIRKK